MRRLALLVLFAFAAHGDTWVMPERAAYDSANGKWRLVTNPGSGSGENAPPDAEMFRRDWLDTWQRASRWNFVGGTFPHHALVANDGTVATFDRGTIDVVVIYRSDGRLVRRLSLNDLLETEDIDQLSRSVSSIRWAGTHRIDEEKRVLVLQIAAHRTEEIPVGLDSGEILEPKRRMFPRPRVEWKAETAPPCLTTEELTARAVTTPMPDYPPVARKARVSGIVILELFIDEHGAVEKVTVLKPLPFGLDDAARQAVSAWRFRPHPEKSCANVTMTFDLTRF